MARVVVVDKQDHAPVFTEYTSCHSHTKKRISTGEHSVITQDIDTWNVQRSCWIKPGGESIHGLLRITESLT
jgi:hypothetical protein